MYPPCSSLIPAAARPAHQQRRVLPGPSPLHKPAPQVLESTSFRLHCPPAVRRSAPAVHASRWRALAIRATIAGTAHKHGPAN